MRPRFCPPREPTLPRRPARGSEKARFFSRARRSRREERSLPARRPHVPSSSLRCDRREEAIAPPAEATPRRRGGRVRVLVDPRKRNRSAETETRRVDRREAVPGSFGRGTKTFFCRRSSVARRADSARFSISSDFLPEKATDC